MRTWIIIFCAVAAACAAHADHFVVGGNTVAYKGPFSACWGIQAFRYQGLVLKTDTIPGGQVTRWEWNAAMGTGAVPQAVLSNFRLKVCHTSLNQLTTPFASNYDGNTPVTVFSANPTTVNPPMNTWFGFDFNPTFNYDGSRNLLVEVWWDGGNNGGPNCWTTSVAGSKRCAVASRVNGVPQNGYPDGGAVGDYSFYMRITLTPSAVAPTSLGRVKALYR